MTAENTDNIPGLDPTKPAFGDEAQYGDDHLRLLKDVLQKQFSGLTGGAVTVSETELNYLAGMTQTVLAALAEKLSLAGGTMTGALTNQAAIEIDDHDSSGTVSYRLKVAGVVRGQLFVSTSGLVRLAAVDTDGTTDLGTIDLNPSGSIELIPASSDIIVPESATGGAPVNNTRMSNFINAWAPGATVGNATFATTAGNCTGNSVTATTAENCTGNSQTATLAANTNAIPADQGEPYTYALCQSPIAATFGVTRAGSSLFPANATGESSGPLSGTWRCMGYTTVGSGQSQTTIWVRIS